MLHRRVSLTSRRVSGVSEQSGAVYPDYDRLPAHMSPDEVRVCSQKIRKYTKAYRLAMLSNDWVLRGACKLHESIAEGRSSIDRMLEPTRRPAEEVRVHLKVNVETVRALLERNAKDVRSLFSRRAFETARQSRPDLTPAILRKEIWTRLHRRRLHAARLIEEVPIRFTKLKPIFDSYAECARKVHMQASQGAPELSEVDFKKVSTKKLLELVSKSGMTPAAAMQNIERASQRRIRRDVELHKLVITNRRLIKSVANKYKKRCVHTDVTVDDLEQGGALGLMRAAILFDPSLGFTFGTYATWWIRNGVQRAASAARGFGDSASKRERRVEVRNARRALSHQHLREPTTQQIVEYLNEHPGSKFRYSLSDVWEAQRRPVTSIDQVIGTDGRTAWKDTLPDDSVGGRAVRATRLEAEDTRAALLKAMQPLSFREKEILVRRSGFHGGPPETLVEVGQRLGLTRERIRQIEEMALRKLKRGLDSNQRKALLEGLES